jgi:hypothetical protein
MLTGAKAAKKRTLAAITRLGLGMAATCLLSLPAWAASEGAAHRAQFQGQGAPDSVHHMADWVTDSGDNGGLPFVIIDKEDAKVFVFDKTGRLTGEAWTLVGLAHGDDSIPGIGTMPLTAITPDMRTTPAGRFVAALGHDLGKLDVLWVDYSLAIALHRVINTNPAERRLERIVSEKAAEHRISYGCINVPAKFFDSVIDPTFKDTKGVVYILPEVKAMQAVFPAYYEVDGKMEAASGGATPVAYDKNSGSVAKIN